MLRNLRRIDIKFRDSFLALTRRQLLAGGGAAATAAFFSSRSNRTVNGILKPDVPVTDGRGFTDRFADDREAGETIGTLAHSAGVVRRGVDVEEVVGIDNGALRVQVLIEPGWGRAAIAYGPYARRNGLALAVFMLNGCHTAESVAPYESFRQYLQRLWRGSETYSGGTRLVQWLYSGRKARTLRKVRQWLRLQEDSERIAWMAENLAVGWFSSPVPADPVQDGNAIMLRTAGPENGELSVRVGTHGLRAIRGVHNLQVYYVTILRETGAAYYAASVPGAYGLSAYPHLRPIAIDPFKTHSPVYPALHKSVSAWGGFWADTRVYGICVKQVPELERWYGTAHVADRLVGSGSLRGSATEAGGSTWTTYEGAFHRGPQGAHPTAKESLAITDPGRPSGLIHTMCQTPHRGEILASLVWRFLDRDNFWRVVLTDRRCQLALKANGTWVEVASSEKWHLTHAATHSIQVLDNGETISIYLQGELLFDTWFQDTRLGEARGVGIHATNADCIFHSFEAHPRTIPLPKSLDLGAPWLRTGTEVIVADDFHGPAEDLAGRSTRLGGQAWRKEIGPGAMDLTGEGSVKIRATAKSPIAGRTAYTVAWEHPEFADVEVRIVPPGTKRGQGERGLSGLVMWQDPDNYFIVNIWLADVFGGGSVAAHFHLDGFEDVYDSIWSNVGERIRLGAPLALRIAFDGIRFTAFVNGQPVLYRALHDIHPGYSRFSINRVGLASNWEWGNDTGSVFQNFSGATL